MIDAIYLLIMFKNSRNQKPKIIVKEDIAIGVKNVDSILQIMTTAVNDLQKSQNEFPGKFSRIALMGMSADVSDLLKRFRKIAGALKSGNDEKVEIAISENKIRKLIGEIIKEELTSRYK